MSDVNPYIEGRKKEIELNERKRLVENDIEFIKRDLERKSKMLIDSRKNHVESYDKQIAEIKATCTHKNEDGNPASSLTHKDILIPVEGGFKRQYFCELCGAKFDGAFIEIESKSKEPIQYLSYLDELKVDDMELFNDNLIFDPNFNSVDFLSTTMTYFDTIINSKKRQ